MYTLLFLAACRGPGLGADSASTDSAAPPAVDLVGPVPAGFARAGVVTDEAALPGGLTAEGRSGDLVLKNDRAVFVVQSARQGHNYIGPGGGVIDADVVRADGEPGRDPLDEHTTMAGIGRMLVAESVTVVSDGSDGGGAVVRAEGPAEPLAILTGATESDGLLPTPDMWVTTDYVLEPDSSLLRVETTVRWEDDSSLAMEPGELLLISYDNLEGFRPGAGLDSDTSPTGPWVGAVGTEGDVALALFPGQSTDADGAVVSDVFSDSPLQDLLEAVGPLMVGLYPARTLEEGQEATHVSYLGVGRDLASLTGAWSEARGEETEQLGGTVVSDLDGSPVPGARVHLLDATGAPWSMALTDAEGRWSATVPAGAVAEVTATGRGDGRQWDYAAGAAFRGPYARQATKDLALRSLSDGGGLVLAEGWERADVAPAGSDSTLTLVAPGTVSVSVDDGGPAMIKAFPAAGDPYETDRRLESGRPDGAMAVGYLAAGSLDLSLPPGDYELLVHRGARYEHALVDVSVVAGEAADVTVSLAEAWFLPGVLAGDPHMHAAPSNDGSITMEQRLLTAASAGLDLHFGTDHDHVVDYRPLLGPLGLDGVLGSVVADEVSPTLRGHFNVYPLEEAPEEQSHGAVRWWEDWQELGDTEGFFAAMREMLGEDGGFIQANHPMEGTGGLVSAAAYDRTTGVVGRPSKWSFDFDAIEVMNAGRYSDVLPVYLDMVARGLEPVPVGVSDAHGPDSKVGNSFTWIDAGVTVAGFTPDDLRDAWRRRATIVSTGPMIHATVDGAWAPGTTAAGPVALQVDVLGPSWMAVDTLELWQDGVLVHSEPTVPTDDALHRTTLELTPDADASYVVIATGSSMSPVFSRAPWAMTAALRVDADGDGSWTSPLPSIVAE